MVPLRTPEEFPATTVLHAKIKVILRLERMIQRHDERVIAGGQNFLLCQSPFDFIAFDHLLLAEYYVHVSEAETTMTKLIDTFHSVQPARFLLSDQVYLPNIPLSNQLDLVKAPRPNLDIPDLY